MTAICIDCSSKKCIELLDIIEKIMLRPIEKKNAAPKDANIKWADDHFEDIYQCTIGLIDIFCSRICQYPFSIPIRFLVYILSAICFQFKKFTVGQII